VWSWAYKLVSIPCVIRTNDVLLFVDFKWCDLGYCKLHCLKWTVIEVGFSSLLHKIFIYYWMSQKGIHLCEDNT
jgi:hypothetical protein